ncbi:MAG: response regulator, partial [Sulfuricurvum sp.]
MIKILSIDDNVNNLATMEAIIKSHCDYEVLSVDNIKDAFNMLSAHRINLIVSDIQMPNIDGFEFARMLLLKKKYQHIPLIFLTANASSPKEAELAYSLGAVDYLTKPIEEIRLMNKIKGYLKPLQDEILLNKMRKMLFDTIRDVIIVADKNKNIIYHNDKALSLFPNISSNPEWLSPCEEAFASMNKVPLTLDFCFMDKEITLKDNIYVYSQLILPDNTLKIQYRDITESKKQEQMIAYSARAAALGEMVGNIAHQW